MAEEGQLSAEILAKINELAMAQFELWKNTTTAEQKQQGIEKDAKIINDENLMAQAMEKIQKAWNDADGDGDGKLNLQEYKAFDAAMRAYAQAEGDWYDVDRTDEAYNEVLNKISEGDGFTMDEMMLTMGPYMAKIEDLKAVAGLAVEQGQAKTELACQLQTTENNIKMQNQQQPLKSNHYDPLVLHQQLILTDQNLWTRLNSIKNQLLLMTAQASEEENKQFIKQRVRYACGYQFVAPSSTKQQSQNNNLIRWTSNKTHIIRDQNRDMAASQIKHSHSAAQNNAPNRSSKKRTVNKMAMLDDYNRNKDNREGEEQKMAPPSASPRMQNYYMMDVEMKSATPLSSQMQQSITKNNVHEAAMNASDDKQKLEEEQSSDQTPILKQMQERFKEMALKNRDGIQTAIEEQKLHSQQIQKPPSKLKVQSEHQMISPEQHQKPQQMMINTVVTPKLVEPSILREFREISSQYLIDQKEDSEAISSNAEFEQADKMMTYNEEDTEVLEIEQIKDWRSKSKNNANTFPPATFIREIQRQKDNGHQAQRVKGLKYFNKIGYMGRDFKEIPRWAASQEALIEVMQHQQRDRERYLKIFGQLKPRHVKEQFAMSQIFSKGEDMYSYMDQERGSSVDWDDQSEFATPIPDRRINQHASRQEGISQTEQKNTFMGITGVGGESNNLLDALGLSAQQPSRQQYGYGQSEGQQFSHISEEDGSRQVSHSKAKQKTPSKFKKSLF